MVTGQGSMAETLSAERVQESLEHVLETLALHGKRGQVIILKGFHLRN